MKARIIQTLHSEFITTTMDADNLIAAMEVPDFALRLFNSDDRQRADAGSAHQWPDVRRRCDPGGMPGNLHFT
ncbi:hypothetical protein N8E89_24090 (plasmid) [Phyllobacterium sp. A18/5-2]|uniref:hypothetical protein n=1 Tax=Phyllobacterium sp. A18/5-2 TaxID=2978392 RepID=UPI0021C640CA|nr:hypothetical protein [Phyllobacterium sp. A18/5-2]UXN66261.1 hypothetical protein N8E89_24090 [Phyllobacterium sp. A18/5-2]